MLPSANSFPGICRLVAPNFKAPASEEIPAALTRSLSCPLKVTSVSTVIKGSAFEELLVFIFAVFRGCCFYILCVILSF